MKKKYSILSNKIIFNFCVIIIFFILVSTLPLLWNTPLKNALVDLQFKIRGNRQLSENIIVVFIGAEDVQALGGWQITRDSLDFKDKLVLIAVTAPGIANLKATVAENLIR